MKKRETPDDEEEKNNGESGGEKISCIKYGEKCLLTWNRGCWEGRGVTPLVS